EAFGPDSATIESPRFEARTMEAPTIDAHFGDAEEFDLSEEPFEDTRRGEPTIEQPTLAVASQVDNTAEINLDDLGLDVSDLEDMSGDLGERAIADDEDTGERLGLSADDELLSATGVTQ